jgi:asparagine synthase (glutamine-hydrolysing)
VIATWIAWGGSVDPSQAAGLVSSGCTGFEPEWITGGCDGLAFALAVRGGERGSPPLAFHVDPATGKALLLHGRIFDSERIADPVAERSAQGGLAARLLERQRKDPEGFARDLNGQFAILVWDPSSRTVVALRDHFGIVPLYYRRSRGGIAFASTAKQLFALDGARATPNARMLARYLVEEATDNRGFSTEETFFGEIGRVRAGHALTAQDGRMHQRPYWRACELFDAPKLEDPDPEEYLQRLQRAVSRRAGDGSGVGAALSGGLDSPAILLLLARSVASEALPTVSFGGFGGAEDEREKIEAVLHRVRGRPTWVRPQDEDVFAALEASTWHQECPTFSPSPVVFYLLRRAAAQQGVRALFGGLGADELLGGLNLGYLADLLWRGRWLRFAREFRAYQAVDGLRLRLAPLALLRAQVLDPLAWLRRARRVPSWIRRDVAQAHRLDLPAEPAIRLRGLSRFDRRISRLLAETFTPAFLHYEAHNASGLGVESRYPYLDLEVASYAARLPWWERSSGGLSKIHHRRAVENLVPSEIRRQTGKTLIPKLHDQWLRETYRERVREILYGDPRAAEFVDIVQVRREHSEYEKTDDERVRNRLRRSTWRTVSMELWFRAFWP